MGQTPVLQISAAGAARPTQSDCLAYVQGVYRSIYGADVYLGEDSQDGQFLALLAAALHDVNGEALAAFNSFSPANAQGAGLDRNVKINGLRRKRATFSTVPFLVVGQAGVRIRNAALTDPAGNTWLLLPDFTIPYEGQLSVPGVCQTIGAVSLPVGGIDTANGIGAISTPSLGFQSATNSTDASVGQPVESDSALRIRQAVSTMLPSLRQIDGLRGALLAIDGANRVEVFQNNNGYRDANGLPGHAIAAVLDGGDPILIGQILELKKGPGVSTYGSTLVTVVPTSGVPEDVRFFYLSYVPISYTVTIQPLVGYTQSIEDQWKTSLAAFTSGLAVGEDVAFDQAYAAAKMYDGPGSKTYKIVSFAQRRSGSAPAANDVPISFFEAASGLPSNIVVTVLPR